MITIDIVFYLPEVLSTPCGNHLCKNHVDVHATEENMLFNRNYVRQRQLLDGCHLEINFEFLHNTLKAENRDPISNSGGVQRIKMPELKSFNMFSLSWQLQWNNIKLNLFRESKQSILTTRPGAHGMSDPIWGPFVDEK